MRVEFSCSQGGISRRKSSGSVASLSDFTSSPGLEFMLGFGV